MNINITALYRQIKERAEGRKWVKRRVRHEAQSLIITLLNVNAAGMSREPNEPERSF